MVVGQLQWAARMICFEEAFEASRLASTLGAPTAKNFQDGSAAIRGTQKPDNQVRCWSEPVEDHGNQRGQ
eukprot:6562105-Pyramimonas_sp.AAC.1